MKTAKTSIQKLTALKELIQTTETKYQWTQHVRDKMRYYRISESLVKRIIRWPKRIQEGIAPGTTAFMQTQSSKKASEIWVMLTQRPTLKIIISAWRYPGVSQPSKPLPIPDDIRAELNL